jgi:long-chain acyl-CoA synthetase
MPALTEGLHRAVKLKPDAPSTSLAPRRRTWRQTVDRVGRVAGAMKALEVGRGDRIAILARNSDRYFELMYATAWVGAALVPMSTRLTASEVEHILVDSGTTVLFIDGTMAHHLTDLEGKIDGVREVVWIDDISSPEGMLHYEDMTGYDSVPDVGAADGELAGIFYDGGVVDPKGVKLSHADMIANAGTSVATAGFDESTIYLHASPMFELAEDALTFGVTLAGGRHVFVPRFDASEVLQIIAADKVTHAQLSPDMIERLIGHPRFAETNLASLQLILYGNVPMAQSLLRKARESLPHVRLIDGDGKSAA